MNTRGLALAVMVATAMMIGGCCEQEKKTIDQLRADNDNLGNQLRQCNEQLDLKDADLIQCRDELSAARNRLSELGAEVQRLKEQEPQLPAGWTVKKGMAMTSLQDKVLFDPGEAKLKSSAAATLKRILAEIRGNFPNRDIYVMGHTDSDPIKVSGWDDNLELSLQRAAAVTRFLIDNGMDPKSVVAAGCGEYRPVAPNSTSAGKAANRRVEFWVLNPVQ